jgi:glycine/D-amino acid oxidase-like deaminating enzyme
LSAKSPRIVVLGAGLQGLCVAMALAERGAEVTVLERRPGPMREASYRNEGKIHLGFVYALDRTLETGRAMLSGAITFASLLDRWCGPLPWPRWATDPFRYCVMPGSLADARQLAAYYTQLAALVPEVADELQVEPGYLGRTLTWFWRSGASGAEAPVIAGSRAPLFETEEMAIDTRQFVPALLERVACMPSISLRCGSHVVGADRVGHRYRIELETTRGRETMLADVVVNCTWADRTRLDATVGRNDPGLAWSYRVKHRVIVRPRTSAGIAPITMVQGPYGDVIPFRDGTVLLSWYPVCRTSFEAAPPGDGPAAGPGDAARIADGTLGALAEYFPALRGAEVLSCDSGVIVARATCDVHDPASGLHGRSESGIRGGDGWWSIDTGKLTLAPYHGERAARQVCEELGLAWRARRGA